MTHWSSYTDSSRSKKHTCGGRCVKGGTEVSLGGVVCGWGR